MQVVSEPIISLPKTSGDSFGPYLRVKMSGGVVALAGPEDIEMGTLRRRVLASGLGSSEVVAVVTPNAPGTVKMIAAGAASVYDVAYGADGGKVNDVENNNPIGIFLTAPGADGDECEVLRLPGLKGGATYAGFDETGGILIDEDFLGDWPASGTALGGEGKYSWTKVETNGLGVTSVDVANGVLKFAADAVAEAATAALYMANNPVDIDKEPIVYFRAAVFDIGDDAAVDFNFGLASDTHATDFDSISEYIAFHLDGNALDLKAQSTDGTNTVAATDTTVNLVDDQWDEFKIDCTDKSDVKLYHRASGATAWTRLLSGTTFDMSAFSGTLTPIVHVEKTSNDSTFDFRVDILRVAAQRA